MSIPISSLNTLRRLAIEEISKQRVVIKERSYDRPNKQVDDKQEGPLGRIENQEDKSRFNVSCQNLDQLRTCLEYEIGDIYYRDIESLGKAMDLCRQAGRDIYFYMPRIIRNDEERIYRALLNLDEDAKKNLRGFRLSSYAIAGQDKFPDK